MAALPDNQPDLLDRLPDEQRALLVALAARGGGPVRARDPGDGPRAADLADDAHVNRLGAGQRLQSLVDLDLLIERHARVYELTDTGRQLLAHRHDQPGTGPTIHTTVLSDRVAPAGARARAEIQRTLGRAGEHLGNWLAAELTRVYLVGVSDGFAQGVAAEAAKHPHTVTPAATESTQ